MALKLRSEKNLLRINQLSLWKRQTYLNVPPRFRWPFKNAHAISQPPGTADAVQSPELLFSRYRRLFGADLARTLHVEIRA
jgi:hypothetical protein